MSQVLIEGNIVEDFMGSVMYLTIIIHFTVAD